MGEKILVMVATVVIAEGFHYPISKGYIYFAIAFSAFMEMLNLKIRSKKTVLIQLREPTISRYT